MEVSEDTNFIYRYIKFCKRIAAISDKTYNWLKLNKVTASRQYHKDLNYYNYTNEKLRQPFFKNGMPIKAEVNTVMNFMLALTSYMRAPTKEIGKQKMKETFEMFSDILETIDVQGLQNCDNWTVSVYLNCQKFAKRNDYDGLYEFLVNAYSGKKSFLQTMKKCMKAVLDPVIRFLCYRVKILYRN